jgi:protein Mpv17
MQPERIFAYISSVAGDAAAQRLERHLAPTLVEGSYGIGVKSGSTEAAGAHTGILDGVVGAHTPDDDWLDAPRAARMGLFGLGVVAPTLHFWYGRLDARIVGPGLVKLLQRVAVDQSIFAPFIVGAFFVFEEGVLALAKGGPSAPLLAPIQASLSEHYVEALKLNYVIWPAAMLVAFKVPIHHRVMFVNLVQVLWGFALSLTNSATADNSTSSESLMLAELRPTWGSPARESDPVRA